MDRHDLLLGAGAITVVLDGRSALADQASRRILLLVELKGGNDGLNTLIPYADPHYHQLRGGIGVARERTLQLDEKVGLHEKLTPLMESWQAKDPPILPGIGN